MLTICDGLDYPVIVEQYEGNKYRVKYGSYSVEGLSYLGAIHEMGACVLHSATCAGTFEPEELDD